MKVLKEGNWNDPWSAQVSCRTCNATLEIEEGDVKPVDNTVGYFILCPICKKQTDVNEDIMSQRVREAVNAKRKYWNSGDGW